MKNTNVNNTNHRNITEAAQEILKKVIFDAAKKSEPSAKQIARDQKKCETEFKRTGCKTVQTYPLWSWYKMLMDNLEITEEYYAGHGNSEIDIVESIFRFTEYEAKFMHGWCSRSYYANSVGRYLAQRTYYNECIKLIADAGLESEFNAWYAERQLYDCNGEMVRVGDIIRFPNITEVCGKPVENGFEAEVDVNDDGLVWIAYPENAWIEEEHLHIPGIPFTAELAKCAEVVIKREEGFIRHPYIGDFILPVLHVPNVEGSLIFVKKS